MGEVRVDVKLRNSLDESLHLRGQLAAEEIRSYTADALVDTGAVPMVIPQFVADQLGLRARQNRVVEYADGRKETVPIMEGLLLEIEGREMLVAPVVLGDEVLIGQIVLEMIDMQVDCANRKLVPNPAHPDQPVIKVKGFRS